MKNKFDSIESVVADLRKGRMVIVVDDADRENEGDLIMAAECVTPAAINFMARHGRGLICVPTTFERLKQLGIEQMVVQNSENFRTDFQVSVDAARGITTGISAADRALHHQDHGQPDGGSRRLGAAGACLSLAGQAGRRSATRRAHRSHGGSGQAGRPSAHGHRAARS